MGKILVTYFTASAGKVKESVANTLADTVEIVDAKRFDGSTDAKELKAWVGSLM